jgi:hypothetical protein
MFDVRKYVSRSFSDAQTLDAGSSPAVHTGQGHQNKIAVVASGSAITFYVNEQQIALALDSNYTSGRLALIASPYSLNGHTTDVAYSNAKLWIL